MKMNIRKENEQMIKKTKTDAFLEKIIRKDEILPPPEEIEIKREEEDM